MRFKQAEAGFFPRGTFHFLPVLVTLLFVLVMTCSRKNDQPVWNNPLDQQGTNWHPPTIMALHNDTVAMHDSVLEKIIASDSGSIITKFYWSIGASGWSDSSGVPQSDTFQIKIASPPAGGLTRIIVGARNNDGAIGKDTFTIFFKRPLSKVMMLSPVNADSGAAQWNTFYGNIGKGSIVFTFTCIDTDRALDTLTYSLLLGKDTNSLAPVYTKGKAATFTRDSLDTSITYFWKLLAYDRFNDSISSLGTFRTSANSVNIKYVFPDSGQVTVVWDSVPGATGYNLYFSPGKTVNIKNSANIPGITSPAIVTTLINGTTYAFMVCAVYNGFEANPGPIQVAIPQKNLITWKPSSLTLTHSAGMVLIRAAGYSFTMGAILQNAPSDQHPAHTVSFTHDFWMDTTDVTMADYSFLRGVDPDSMDLAKMIPQNKYPVENATWYDALLYCNARSKRDKLDTVYSYTDTSVTYRTWCTNMSNISIDYTKNGYRLPTEAEWEYACRGGTSTQYYWGDDSSVATMRQYCSFDSSFAPFKVAVKKPNAYGLYDMNGNVSQWCNDWYNNQGYGSGSQIDPAGGPSTDGFKMLRGGWNLNSGSFFVAGSPTRTENSPENYQNQNYGSNYTPSYSQSLYGFRCVRTIQQALSAPSITTSPQSQTVTIGDGASFSAFASGNPFPTYQWLKNGVPISNATLNIYSISSTQMTDSGKYTVVATNAKGSDTSGAAILTVKPPVPTGLVANTISSTKITLQWNPVIGATSYKIFQSTKWNKL